MIKKELVQKNSKNNNNNNKKLTRYDKLLLNYINNICNTNVASYRTYKKGIIE